MASITGINSYLMMFGGGSSYNYGNTLQVSNTNSTATTNLQTLLAGYSTYAQPQNTKAPALSTGDALSYLSALKTVGSDLKNAVSNLAATGSDSVFNKLIASSSNTDALSVSVSKQEEAAKLTNASLAKKVNIQQLAAAQQNTGSTLSATAINSADTGSNAFTIEKGGKQYQFSVNINLTDSVRTAQQKTADAINSKNIGITAAVNYDSTTKKSTLVLTANDTGESNAFSIADTPEKGSLITSLGVDNTTRAAQNAQYTVDDTAYTSEKNTVDLGDGLTGTLKKVTDEAVDVGLKKNVTGIQNALYDVINQFNGLRETAKTYADDKGAKSLLQKLDGISTSYASSLKNIGVSLNKDGYLQVDADKMKSAFENQSAERYLGNSTAGFTQRLSQLSKSLNDAPEQFISYQSRNQMNASDSGNAYDNYLNAYRNAQSSYLNLLLNIGV